MKKEQPAVFTFQFENSKNHEVRTVLRGDGSIWFVAKDVCDVLNITNARKSVGVLDDDEKNTVTFSDGIRRGNPKMNIISESGLYTLVLRSNKPEAREFRKWVTSEVLPQIRKTGAYQIDPPTPTPAKTVSPEKVIAFLQVSTDAYWHTIRALNKHRVIEGELRKARKDITAIVESIKEMFPDARDVFDDIMMKGISDTSPNLPLILEMHK